MKEYSSCRPRNCGIDRNSTTGYCREKSSLHVARASLHMWEEPCISGSNGSGTVFFSGCNMGCVFCQNRAISRGEAGKTITWERLSEIFFELQDLGANNINLVTGDMFIPTIVRAIDSARQQGIKIPFLFNTSSYLNVDSVKMLDGLIDIYLPDFKYIREEDSVRYSNAPGYPNAAKDAIQEMVHQQPDCFFSDERKAKRKASENDRLSTPVYQGNQKIIQKGVIVRHLLMPGMLIQAKLIVKYLHEHYGDNIYLSLMSQYTTVDGLSSFPEIDRKVTNAEYKSLVEYATGIGVENGFVQEGEAAGESFIPEFDLRGV